jgi:hypothetical protein
MDNPPKKFLPSKNFIFKLLSKDPQIDRLCGVVARVPEARVRFPALQKK